MKYLNGEHYVEVRDHRYKIHPTKDIFLRKRDEPKSLGTENQIQNETQIRKNQKVIKNENDQSIVKKNSKIKINNQLFNNNFQIVPVVREKIG